MKFLVDQPLEGLARWLRLCGFDASDLKLTGPHSRPPSPAPATYILTKRQSLQKLPRPDVLVIAAPTPEEQLAEVFQRLKILPDRLKPLSRCSRCNEPLTPVSRDQVQGRVPEHVFHYQSQFYECPRCHRLFWPGSHLKGIIRTLVGTLESEED